MNCLTHCWWQILAAAVAYWMIGALWYYPKVFGTIWQKSHGLPEMTEDKMKEVKMMMPRMLLTSFAGALLICVALCYVLCASCGGCCIHCTGPDMCMPMLMHTIKVALLLSIGINGGTLIMGYVYQMKPLSAYLIDMGYHVVATVVAAVVLHFTMCHCG